MWIDHCTLAIRGSPFDIKGLENLGAPLLSVRPWVQGTARHLIFFSNAFLEVVSLLDPLAARRTVWGRAVVRFLRQGDGIFRVTLGHPDMGQFLAERSRLGVRWWPPIESHIFGVDDAAFPVSMTQIDPLMPFVVHYTLQSLPLPTSAIQLAQVMVASPIPTLTARHYQWTLGLPLLAPTRLDTDNASLVMVAGEPGFNAIELSRNNRPIVLKPEAGQLRITVG